jgi:hypothetical protein
MNLANALIPFMQMPPPPGTGSSGGSDDWWRILGVLLITVFTVGIFAWLFRPAAQSAATEVTDSDLAMAGPAATTTPSSANVVPFRDRALRPLPPVDDKISEAAAERLRRLTTTPDPPAPTPVGGRRRLGSRRTWIPTPTEPQTSQTSPEPPPVTSQPSEPVVAQSTGKEPVVEQPTVPETSLPSIGAFPPRSPSGEELLGGLVDKLPSAEDSDIVLPFKTMTGPAPTEQDLKRIDGSEGGPAKIVQFVPRLSKEVVPPIDDSYRLLEDFGAEGNEPTRLPVDPTTRQSITATVQELLFCANVGEFMHGFALYTDRYLFQFMTESGFTEETFRETFTHMPGKEPQDWTRIERISNMTRLDDGRIAADVFYLERDQQTQPERFVFKVDHITHRWLIDGITAI